MSKRSEEVKRWRRECKARIISSMGGCCCICGYNKCQRALALHHLNPEEKDFNFGSVRANIKSWAKIVAELRKCILLCHNCHSEIHDCLITIPINHPSFNEEFLEYKNLENSSKGFIKKVKEVTECKICKKFKPKAQIYCSLECSAKGRVKINWDNIDLEKELKTKSVLALSKELGISDNSIHKRLKKLGLK